MSNCTSFLASVISFLALLFQNISVQYCVVCCFSIISVLNLMLFSTFSDLRGPWWDRKMENEWMNTGLSNDQALVLYFVACFCHKPCRPNDFFQEYHLDWPKSHSAESDPAPLVLELFFSLKNISCCKRTLPLGLDLLCISDLLVFSCQFWNLTASWPGLH